MITMPLSGCTSADNIDEEITEKDNNNDLELSDWNVYLAATSSDLPVCNEDTNGRLYYVEDLNQYKVFPADIASTVLPLIQAKQFATHLGSYVQGENDDVNHLD